MTTMTTVKNRHRHWWIWLLVVAYVAFIFYNSMEPASVSSAISTEVAEHTSSFLEHFGIAPYNFDTFHYFIRKLAHFLEFMGLGCIVSIAINVCPLFKHRSLNFITFLLLIPFSDEMIQSLIPGRETLVTDMLIDCSGILIGGLIGYILILICKDLFHHVNKQETNNL